MEGYFDGLPAHLVAPHTGAWIETAPPAHSASQAPVAPHTGAWIETVSVSGTVLWSGSRAPHGRVD